MIYWGEKKSEDFLEDNGLKVVKRAFVKKKRGLKKGLMKVGFPCVMKISSSKIVHKNRAGGVIKNINNYSVAINAYSKLRKIKGFDGVVLQKEILGKEMILGLKRTPEFGHVVIFGSGGNAVEEEKDVSFRAIPFDEKEAKKMISSTKISKKLKKKEKDALIDKIIDLQKIAEHYPKISELDINPLIVKGDLALVVDSRIVFRK